MKERYHPEQERYHLERLFVSGLFIIARIKQQSAHLSIEEKTNYDIVTS